MMQFIDTKIKGAYVLSYNASIDARGKFLTVSRTNEFISKGLDSSFVQTCLSYNPKKGTLRGLHYQKSPFEETKLVVCVRGTVYDVILDLRRGSPTFEKWDSFTLGMNYNAIYIPKGVAHGFQTLVNGSVLLYQMSEFYHSEVADGIRWDDPYFKIVWPEVQKRIISEKDLSWKDYFLSSRNSFLENARQIDKVLEGANETDKV